MRIKKRISKIRGWVRRKRRGPPRKRIRRVKPPEVCIEDKVDAILRQRRLATLRERREKRAMERELTPEEEEEYKLFGRILNKKIVFPRKVVRKEDRVPMDPEVLAERRLKMQQRLAEERHSLVIHYNVLENIKKVQGAQERREDKQWDAETVRTELVYDRVVWCRETAPYFYESIARPFILVFFSKHTLVGKFAQTSEASRTRYLKDDPSKYRHPFIRKWEKARTDFMWHLFERWAMVRLFRVKCLRVWMGGENALNKAGVFLKNAPASVKNGVCAMGRSVIAFRFASLVPKFLKRAPKIEAASLELTAETPEISENLASETFEKPKIVSETPPQSDETPEIVSETPPQSDETPEIAPEVPPQSDETPENPAPKTSEIPVTDLFSFQKYFEECVSEEYVPEESVSDDDDDVKLPEYLKNIDQIDKENLKNQAEKPSEDPPTQIITEINRGDPSWWREERVETPAFEICPIYGYKKLGVVIPDDAVEPRKKSTKLEAMVDTT